MGFSLPTIAYQKILRSLSWRWHHLGKAASHAVGLYLFPAYIIRWTWQGYALFLMMVFGYGNVKYFLLLLPFIWEVKPDD